jgi:K+-sensing histidine kinase KdpD
MELYGRNVTGEFYGAGLRGPEGMEDELRHVALPGASSMEARAPYVIVGVSRGSEPVASMALRGATLQESVLQGAANLVAIGLERARAQDLAQQVEAARQSEQLRTTLIDAMAHEFKTLLTLIKAATTSLLANPDIPPENRKEQLTIADERSPALCLKETLLVSQSSRCQINLVRRVFHPVSVVKRSANQIWAID